jgi:hypothetical protein
MHFNRSVCVQGEHIITRDLLDITTTFFILLRATEMKKIVFSALLTALLGFATLANANLVNNGGGLMYDTSQNVTWYDFMYAGSLSDALAWAAALNIGGATGWTLPTSDTCSGFSCAGSQIGYLYFNTLGLTAGTTPSNLSPFTQLAPGPYLSSREDPADPSLVWGFDFRGGFQGPSNENALWYAVAVHTGNVGAAVPIPAAVWLLGSGLIGLFGIRRFKK